MLIVLIFIVWYFIGAFGFYYNWTKEFDLRTSDLPLMFIYGFGGVISAIAWWLTMNDDKTIFKKRK